MVRLLRRFVYAVGVYYLCVLVNPLVPSLIRFLYDTVQNVLMALEAIRITIVSLIIYSIDPEADIETFDPSSEDQQDEEIDNLKFIFKGKDDEEYDDEE